MTRTQEFSFLLTVVICLVIPVLCWMSGWVYVFNSSGFPPGISVPGGMIVGLLIGTLIIRFSGSRLLEIGCTAIPISALFIILIPIFGQARTKAQMVSCKKNLIQLAVGFARYKADHDGQLPPEKSWEAALAKYLPAKAFVCPVSKHGYHYEAGRNRRLLTEAPQCHGEWSMTLFAEGRVKALKISPPPTPGPALLARQ